MSHVQVSNNDDGGYRLVVDGIDLSAHVQREGFKIVLGESPEHPATVHVVIPADLLDVDLPDALVQAMRVEVTE